VSRLVPLRQPLYQQTGMRWSRALPYELGVDAHIGKDGRIRLQFNNTGAKGAVFPSMTSGISIGSRAAR